MKAALFGDASEIEIGVQPIFIGVRRVHQRDRDPLGELPKMSYRRRLIAHEDTKENRRCARCIFSKRVTDVDNL